MCEHKNKIKAGLSYQKSGVFQRWQCKDCRKIWICGKREEHGTTQTTKL